MASILLVEPDRIQAALYAEALKRDKHQTILVRTAAQAVTALDLNHIELIILELNLATHNGIELLYELRSYSDWQAIRVILHTTVRPKLLHAPALKQLGVSKVLYKPATALDELRSSVQSLLQSVA